MIQRFIKKQAVPRVHRAWNSMLFSDLQHRRTAKLGGADREARPWLQHAMSRRHAETPCGDEQG